MKRASYLSIGLMMISGVTFASGTDSTAAKSPFTFSGYVDSYYFKNLNNPLNGSNLGTSGFERIFDQKEGQVQIGLVQTKFGYTNNKSEVVVDLTFGPHSDLGNYMNFISLNGLGPGTTGGPITSTALAIKQAYFTYKATDKLSFTAGQFGTHVGYEVIDAPVNFNYSLSNLFGNGPFYHTGVKANYAFTEKVGLMVGVVNSWDAIFDNNRSKSFVSQLFLSPAEGFNIYLNYIGGNENVPVPAAGKPAGINAKDTVGSIKQMIDLTTGYQLTEKFYVGLNAAFGGVSNIPAPTVADPKKTETRTWGGVALYSNYAFTDRYALGIRAEKFDNTQGVQYIGATDVTSLTATLNVTLAEGHLLLKPEVRMDTYKKLDYTGPSAGDIQQFEDSKGEKTKNSQTTIGMAAIYKF